MKLTAKEIAEAKRHGVDLSFAGIDSESELHARKLQLAAEKTEEAEDEPKEPEINPELAERIRAAKNSHDLSEVVEEMMREGKSVTEIAHAVHSVIPRRCLDLIPTAVKFAAERMVARNESFRINNDTVVGEDIDRQLEACGVDPRYKDCRTLSDFERIRASK